MLEPSPKTGLISFQDLPKVVDNAVKAANKRLGTVPDTAPTATSTAMTFDQRRASSSAAASPRLMPIQCAISVTAGKAMPKHARMM